MTNTALFQGAEAPGPRVFGLPPGADFPRLLVRGLHDRLSGQPPEAMARITLFVNTERMRRRITWVMTRDGAGFLPRLRLVTDLTTEAALAGLPPAVPPLRRRLEIAQLVRRLLKVQPDLAPESAAFDLADSLATLIDEMQGEGVPPETVMGLDVSHHSAHWQRTQQILAIIVPLFADATAPDTQMRLRMAVTVLEALWVKDPPPDPVIIAGSTGSRGTTAQLMQAVAALPQGAIILPGYDTDLPDHIWQSLDNALTAEDHPQYRFHKLRQALKIAPEDVRPWVDALPPDPARNRLISLALRPAPVTDQWLTEGAGLGDLLTATNGMTLIEAPSRRQEALALALILREAAEDQNLRVALITPDRGLTRMVTAALDRWGIRPDDSAGRPLGLTPPGRLLRHVVELAGIRITAQDLLTLLKHPLTASGSDRGNHLRLTRELELHLRRHGPAFPTAANLLAWGRARKDAETAEPWCSWLAGVLERFAGMGDAASARALGEHLALHVALTDEVTRGADGQGTATFWEKEAGLAAAAMVAELAAEAEHGGTLTLTEYRNLFTALIARGEVREDVEVHPQIMIWGTLEARVQGADLVLLAGLNEGVWPAMPPADPWLNRQMRLTAGLLLPERRIGLSAHDFQQAIGAPRVILSRAQRDVEAQTVPSRWLNRLTNLLDGLPEVKGKAALAAMRERGQGWLQMAGQLEAPVQQVPSASRPSPRPPVAARPAKLSVTNISRLIRDPYAIYARHILRLYPLDPLAQMPDARLRGSVLHRILETYVRARLDDGLTTRPRAHAKARLMAIARDVLADEVPWPDARALWLARLARAADFFLDHDTMHGGIPVIIETDGKCRLDPLPFTLTAKPDRIDILPDGRAHVIDYKTGKPPSADAQKHFDKQLLIEAAMIRLGAFAELGPIEPARATYIGLGSSPAIEEPVIDDLALDTLWADLQKLIGRYMQPGQGYTARRAPAKADEAGDYDHLARFGEWGMGDAPVAEDLE